MNFKSHSLLISLLLHSVSENEVVQVLCLTNHALIFPFYVIVVKFCRTSRFGWREEVREGRVKEKVERESRNDGGQGRGGTEGGKSRGEGALHYSSPM